MYKQMAFCVSPSRLPLRGMTMREPRPPPMTLWGRRSGGFLKEPVYWWRKEWTLWADGGWPFLTMGSAEEDTIFLRKKPKIQACIWLPCDWIFTLFWGRNHVSLPQYGQCFNMIRISLDVDTKKLAIFYLAGIQLFFLLNNWLYKELNITRYIAPDCTKYLTKRKKKKSHYIRDLIA